MKLHTNGESDFDFKREMFAIQTRLNIQTSEGEMTQTFYREAARNAQKSEMILKERAGLYRKDLNP